MRRPKTDKPRVVSVDLIAAWKAEQARLRERLIVQPLAQVPRFVAGADAAFSEERKKVIACAVVYDREKKEIIEIQHAIFPLEVPYVPTFLSFREGPAVIAAIRLLKHPFGVICFDGQGYAHPRRCGLATHIGVTLDLPAIGCAKSRLIGKFEEPAADAGSESPLMDKQEQIGLVLRTRAGVSPIFISVGHRMDLESAKRVVQACQLIYRIPEPTRQADKQVALIKKNLLALAEE